jgi:hypothetical protein
VRNHGPCPRDHLRVTNAPSHPIRSDELRLSSDMVFLAEGFARQIAHFVGSAGIESWGDFGHVVQDHGNRDFLGEWSHPGFGRL